ncbi:MAG: sugar-binding protein, partial [Gammaproteobacteria bacterium]|nr:sugar-binding protein [Gammaproteobacteria bacterium]
PSSLPGYLIRLKAELKVDGETVASAGGFTMGQELSSTTGITRLAGGWHSAHNKPIAGEFYAFGLDLQGIGARQMEAAKERMETVKARLEARQFEGLTKDGIIGDMLYAAATGYFAANDVNLKLLNRAGKAIAYRQPSFGTFSTNLDPVYSFGVPRQVEMSGIMVDMDAVVQSLWAKDNNPQTSKAVGQQVGMMTSAFEHRIPELFFTNEQNPGEAVSAVKALAIASAQGQRIYQ